MRLRVEPAPVIRVGQQPQGVKMNDVPKHGTVVGLAIRSMQFVFAVITFVVMASTDFTDVPAFSFLVVAAGLLCLWSFSLIILYVYTLSVRRRLHQRLDILFTVGDGITGVLLFLAACASGAVSYFISTVSIPCTYCGSYASSTVFAFFSVFVTFLSFFLNLSSWASRSQAA